MSLLDGIAWTQEAEDYFFGRGVSPDTADQMMLGEWIGAEVLDPTFTKQYRVDGSRLLGWICWPVRTPDNRVVGCEFRRRDKKEIVRYIDHEHADAHAIWTCRPDAFQRMWNGGEAWLAEGLFDMAALEWAVPVKDAVLAMGTAKVNAKQVESLRRVHPEFVNVLTDRDAVGVRASVYNVKVLTDAGLRVRQFVYGGGKDPGEIWTKGGKQAVIDTFRR